MSFCLSRRIDIEQHNADVKRVWEAFHARRPWRVPVHVAGSIRNLFGNPELNSTGYTFQDFFEDPEAQIQCQLAYQKWRRYHLLFDQEMGPPRGGWQVGIDFQNSYDAAWFGCPLRCDGNYVPDTVEILKERKERLYDLPDPDPLAGGIAGRAMEFFDYMHERCPRLDFDGLPVKAPEGFPGEGSDGPLTVAYKLRGAAEVCLDMYEAPGYFHDLMDYITRNLIRRAKAVRAWRWSRFPEAADKGREKRKEWAFADDPIAMISTKDYEEFVLPYHRRLVAEFSDGGPIAIHLCGDASHQFKFLYDRLNVRFFDTGFPIDLGKVRRELGPEAQIQGGPTIMLLRDGTPEAVRAEVKRICESGIMEGGRFILREANNLAPCTPVENIAAMYDAAMEFGVYRP